MKIFTWNDILTILNDGSDCDYFKNGCGISVGSFDGLHCGHRFLLDCLVSSCRKKNYQCGAVTFTRPLPSIKHNNDYKGDISTLSQRKKLLESLGLDFIILVDFDESFASMLGSDFFTILLNVCNLKIVAEGVDFKCGYKGAMDIQALKYFCGKNNIQSLFVNPVYYDSGNGKIYTQNDNEFENILHNDEIHRVSSSMIRKLIQKGYFNTVELLLNRKYSLDFESFQNELQQLHDSKKQTEIEIKKIFQVLPPAGKYLCNAQQKDECKLQITQDKIILQRCVESAKF